MPMPLSKEFRDEVIRVAQNRDPEVALARVAKDFGVHVATLDTWMAQARIDAGERPGERKSGSSGLRERDRVIEQDVWLLR